jgi:hypothetical protein
MLFDIAVILRAALFGGADEFVCGNSAKPAAGIVTARA